MFHKLLMPIYCTWKSEFSKSDFIKELLITVLFVSQVLFILPKVLQYCEGMEGLLLSDWILNSIEPRDFSREIFFLEYTSVFIILIRLMRNPLHLIRGMQAYAFLLILRMLSIYLVPLEPPGGMIYLKDFITSSYLDKEDLIITKDLFFSGHVSALFLLYLLEKNKYIKNYVLISSILVGIMLMLQRVHYSIDILFAPIGAWLSYQAVQYIHKVRVNIFTKKVA